MKFINRQRELSFLEREYTSEGASFVVIYGRRRLGKTALIREFIRNKPGSVYFLADRSAETVTINLFADVVRRTCGRDLWPDVRLTSWGQAFDLYLQSFSTGNSKQILVLDEFQYLVWSNKAFSTVLQRIWDERLKDRNIFLIICGSSVSMMLSEALNYHSPLYGRRTGQVELKPLSFSALREFIPRKNPVFQAEIYGLTGGVPKYLEFFNSTKTVFEQILQSILDIDHFLNQEARFILSEEVNEPINYFAILKSISAGNRKISAISSDLQVGMHRLSPYLSTLQQIGLVERQVPVTETMAHKSKKGLYRISDCYLRFWFRFIYPNLSDISLGNTGWLLRKIKIEFNDFMGSAFEDICRQMIPTLFPGSYDRIGSWWDKRHEVDILAINRSDQTVLLGECKWSNRLVGKEVLIRLREIAGKIDFGFSPAGIKFILFTKRGFKKELRSELSGECLLYDFTDAGWLERI